MDAKDVILVYFVLAVSAGVQWMSARALPRALLGLPSFLFPRRYEVGFPHGSSERSPGPTERLLPPPGTSLSPAPLVVLGYALLEVPVARYEVTTGSSVLTAAGEIRRRQAPRSERFVVPFGRRFGALGNDVGSRRDDTDSASNVAIVSALASLEYGLLVPNSDERYSDVYPVTGNEIGGVVGADSPVNLPEVEHASSGEEGRDGVRAPKTEQLQHRSLSVSANGTGYATPSGAPSSTGARLRLGYLRYVDETPEERTTDDACRSVYLRLKTNENAVENWNENGLRSSSVPRRRPIATPLSGEA